MKTMTGTFFVPVGLRSMWVTVQWAHFQENTDLLVFQKELENAAPNIVFS